MEFERLASGIYLEGLAIDGDAVWYTDVIGGGIHRRAANGETQSWLQDQLFLAALALNDDGRVLYTGGHGIAWLHPNTGATGILLDTVDGERLPGVNEMTPDGAGGLYFGTIDLASIAKGEKSKGSALYHLHVDGGVKKLCEGLKFSNGLGLSADGMQLFHNETFVGAFRYEVGANDTLGAPAQLLDTTDTDGMALDAAGGVWVSGCRSSDLIRLLPSGECEHVSTPSEATTNVRFGGAGGEWLYINTVTLDAVEGIVSGNLPKAENSVLYRARSNVRGIPPARTRFRLS